MAKSVFRLTALNVGKLNQPGLFPDGGGLFLQVRGPSSKSWLLRYSLNGRVREMGLGSARIVSLSEARARAAEARKLAADGVDPIAERDRQRAAQAAADNKTLTFAECAAAFIVAKRPGWKSLKHADQWETTLRAYVYPVMGKLAVQQIDVGLVMRVLDPIWNTKRETASRLRGRIEAILDWAKVRGYRDGENPARWRGHLEHQLATRRRQVKHHAAIPYRLMPEFISDLRTRDGVAASALEFLIFTATRTSEALGARWSEIDLDEKIWTIPAGRMKSGHAHRVPLSDGAMQVLTHMQKIIDGGDFVFYGSRYRRPLSNMALLVLLRRMRRDDITAHGFRSTFRDWAAERTSFPREIAEAALAHRVADAVERAYARTDFFDRRRELMDRWGEFCALKEAPLAERSNVTPVRAQT